MTKEETESNRRAYIKELRENPLGLSQRSDAQLGNYRKLEPVCAIGLGLHTFDIDPQMEPEYNPDTHQYWGPYEAFYEKLGVHAADYIWQMNDLQQLTFSEIADQLEDKWFGG